MFEFLNSSCVVVGTFNIYIIQPQWLAEIGIIPEGEPVKMQVDFRNPGFKFHPTNDSIKWAVRPDRLLLQSESRDADCGEPLVKVLRHLQWTPIIAVGCNVTFKAPMNDLEMLSYVFGTVADQTQDGYVISQKTWHRSLKRDRTVFNVQLSTQEEHIELSLNAHTEVRDEKGLRSSNEVAQETCASFLRQREESVSLAKSLLNEVKIQL